MPPKKSSTQAKPVRVKRREYVCVTPCWHLNVKWKKGRRAKFADDELPRDKHGNMIHFEEVDPFEPPTPPPEEVVKVNADGGPVK
jgi:hypothetical protein